ncbi:hypothetical protein E2C01_050901 [Portunus trituberculatus]|uniref:Uncharacterized protein n=1 Tax=Portunus trituberculatus TaxID=210409 RepID=A0A5B7GHP5_PORTR|nr:hypothetical protein [Portunus trituberculatus]
MHFPPTSRYFPVAMCECVPTRRAQSILLATCNFSRMLTHVNPPLPFFCCIINFQGSRCALFPLPTPTSLHLDTTFSNLSL